MSTAPRTQLYVALGYVERPDGAILVGRRHAPENPRVHGKLQFPGGGIEFGENPVDTVRREVREETGLEVVVGPLIPHMHSQRVDHEDASFHILVVAYRCTLVDPAAMPHAGDEECRDWEWRRPEDVPADEALDGIGPIIIAARGAPSA